jgi:hypothetical protein
MRDWFFARHERWPHRAAADVRWRLHLQPLPILQQRPERRHFMLLDELSDERSFSRIDADG